MVKIGSMGMDDLQAAEPSRILASDLADGRLHGEAFVHAIEAIGADAAGLQAWHMVHLVGDVMRSRELAGRCLDVAFANGVQERLAAATFDTSLDVGFDQPSDDRRSVPVQTRWSTRAANRWNWAAVAAFGAMAVALSMTWSTGGLWTSFDGAASIAKNGAPFVPTMPVAPAESAAPAPVVASIPPAAPASIQAAPQVMIRDPRLDELLAAHRQLGGTSALQKPAGFFRNAAHQEESSR